MTARDLNPNIHIVARAAEEQAESKLIRAGANRVVAPTIIGGHRMAMALTKPAVGDFLDSVTANHLELGFEQLEVDPASTLVGRKLSETVIRSELNIVVVSIRRNDGEIIFNPDGGTKIEACDMLIGIGNADSLARLNALARGRAAERAIDSMKTLVTGGSGYLGTFVVNFFGAETFPAVQVLTFATNRQCCEWRTMTW